MAQFNKATFEEVGLPYMCLAIVRLMQSLISAK
jgi:hypothetical protein